MSAACCLDVRIGLRPRAAGGFQALLARPHREFCLDVCLTRRSFRFAKPRDPLLDLSDAGLDRGDSVHPQPSIGRAVRDLSQSVNGYQRTAAGRSATFDLAIQE